MASASLLLTKRLSLGVSALGSSSRLETGDADSPMEASWRIMLTAREPLTRGAAEPALTALEPLEVLPVGRDATDGSGVATSMVASA